MFLIVKAKAWLPELVINSQCVPLSQPHLLIPPQVTKHLPVEFVARVPSSLGRRAGAPSQITVQEIPQPHMHSVLASLCFSGAIIPVMMG